MKFIEKYGSGLRRVFGAFEAHDLSAPDFDAIQGGVAVTIFKAHGKRPELLPELLAGLQMDAKVLR